MNEITILEKQFSRTELITAQKKINKKSLWASDDHGKAEKTIDQLLKNVTKQR